MSEWIGVEDRLPKPDGDVLVFRDGLGDILVSEFYLHQWVDNSDQGLLDGVTHWMPLPEPPKD